MFLAQTCTQHIVIYCITLWQQCYDLHDLVQNTNTVTSPCSTRIKSCFLTYLLKQQFGQLILITHGITPRAVSDVTDIQNDQKVQPPLPPASLPHCLTCNTNVKSERNNFSSLGNELSPNSDWKSKIFHWEVNASVCDATPKCEFEPTAH